MRLFSLNRKLSLLIVVSSSLFGTTLVSAQTLTLFDATSAAAFAPYDNLDGSSLFSGFSRPGGTGAFSITAIPAAGAVRFAQSINLTGFTHLSITGTRGIANTLSTFSVFFLDNGDVANGVSFSSAAFSTDTPTTVTVSLASVISGYSPSSLASLHTWAIGGPLISQPGTNFDFTFNNVSAIPEPSTYAAIMGVGVLGLAIWRKKRKQVAPVVEA